MFGRKWSYVGSVANRIVWWIREIAWREAPGYVVHLCLRIEFATEPTEQHIASQLEARQKSIGMDYAYAVLPLADIMNKGGGAAAGQACIDEIHQQVDPA